VFDLTKRTPLLTSKSADESNEQWDASDETGLRFTQGLADVEYWRDVRPILRQSCTACHSKESSEPAGGLVLDDDEPVPSGDHRRPPHLPTSYKNVASNRRYIEPLQSRRSALVWKLFGKRMDGQSGKAPVKLTKMPPPEAVAGTYKDASGKQIKVPPLTDEQRLTLIRWIDLGCTIDLRFDPERDDPATPPVTDRTLPTLTVTHPRGGASGEPLERILIGAADAGSGLDMSSFSVVADFTVNEADASRELAAHFRQISPGVWELALKEPIRTLAGGKITVQIADRERNVSRIERTFSVKP
jgi:hypothetical protein